MKDLSTLQGDVKSETALKVWNQALGLIGPTDGLSSGAQNIRELITNWDGHSSADSVGATAYHVFEDYLVEAYFKEWLGKELYEQYRDLDRADLRYPLRDQLAFLVVPPEELNNAQEGFLQERNRMQEAIGESVKKTWNWLSVRVGANRKEWRWGGVHRLNFYPFQRGLTAHREASQQGVLGPFALKGDGETVFAAEFSAQRKFGVRVASVYRFAVDAGQSALALSSLAPGQSEHSGHPHYQDGVEGWALGQPRLLVTDQLLIDEMTAARLVIEPIL